MAERLLITVREAARVLALSRSKVYELLAAGAFDSVKIDGSRRIVVASLNDYVTRLAKESAA